MRRSSLGMRELQFELRVSMDHSVPSSFGSETSVSKDSTHGVSKGIWYVCIPWIQCFEEFINLCYSSFVPRTFWNRMYKIWKIPFQVLRPFSPDLSCVEGRHPLFFNILRIESDLDICIKWVYGPRVLDYKGNVEWWRGLEKRVNYHAYQEVVNLPHPVRETKDRVWNMVHCDCTSPAIWNQPRVGNERI